MCLRWRVAFYLFYVAVVLYVTLLVLIHVFIVIFDL
jgi:hypothetical protein